jgi:hypothetical protein
MRNFVNLAEKMPKINGNSFEFRGGLFALSRRSGEARLKIHALGEYSCRCTQCQPSTVVLEKLSSFWHQIWDVINWTEFHGNSRWSFWTARRNWAATGADWMLLGPVELLYREPASCSHSLEIAEIENCGYGLDAIVKIKLIRTAQGGGGLDQRPKFWA